MSGLFKTPKPPKPAAPTPMPDPEDVQARKARRLQMENAQKRAGRESTILSGEKTGDYSKQTLG
jgi:hypothetical protein